MSWKGIVKIPGAAGLLVLMLASANPGHAVPTVDERPFIGEEVDGVIADGIEFTVNNPSDSPGPIFSWVIFMEGDRTAEATNFWGYQTIDDAGEWNAAIVSDGVITPGVGVEQPLSWAQLFAPVSDEAEGLLDSGLIGLGFFLNIDSSDSLAPDFTIDGVPFQSPDFLAISPGFSGDGFFALDEYEPGSPAAFAHLPDDGTNAPFITVNSDFPVPEDVPEPASLALLSAGLLGLGLVNNSRSSVRRRREISG